MQNNPIRYTDPTGHLLLENEGGGGCSTSGYCAGNNSSSVSIGDGGSGSLGGNANTDFDHTSPMPVPIENNFVSNYCGESSFFGCTSMFMQDSASMIDLVGMGVVSTFTITGCVVGVPGGGEGILAGCIAGGIEGLLFYNLSGLNTAEFILSAGSTMFTLLDDYLDDGEIGEASNTSITATMVGAVMVDPFTDALIDGYVSGYNHGIFNGIVDLYNGFPIIVVR